MNLTDKIDTWKIANYTGVDTKEDDIYQSGINYCLTNITPKIVIDFAKWLRENCSTYEKWEPIELDDNMYRLREGNEEFTSKQLFEEFLKDYKYE